MLKFFQNIKNMLRVRKLGEGNKLALTGKLFAKKTERGGVVVDLGLVAVNEVTTAGAGALVDAFQSTGVVMCDFYFHGQGTSTGTEGSTETALGAEVETRTSGTRVETSAVVFKTIATKTFTTTGGHAITEHGIFNALTTGTGTLWDRSKFAAINVSTGDSIEFTYELTVTAGG